MEIFKTMAGQHLLKLFPEGPALHIATLLPVSKTEIAGRAAAEFKRFYEKLTHYTVKGKMPSFERYTNNLKYGPFGVYSYGTEVIKLNWKHQTAKRLGRWSPTTSRHMNYAIQMLRICYDFKEIK